MKAIVFEQFGEPDEVVGLREVADPSPGPGEVRVRMIASPVNPSDLMTIRGMYSKLPSLPATPGYEGVGVVEESGGGMLGRYLKGKRVAVLNRDTGNWAEQTVIPARQAIPIPKGLSDDQAAMFFVNPATAYLMTRRVLRIPEGVWLLQTAAGSAVGKMVIRLGRRFGFRTINVVRREAQTGELSSLGADEVLHFDPDSHDPGKLRDEVMGVTDGRGVPFAIDPVGGAVASACVECLGSSGRMLVYGTLTAEPLTLSSRQLIGAGGSIAGFWLSNHMDGFGLPAKLKLVRELGRLIRDKVLSSDVGGHYPLENIGDAVRESEAAARGGKVLLQIGK